MRDPQKSFNRLFTWLTGPLLLGLVTLFAASGVWFMYQYVDFSVPTSWFSASFITQTDTLPQQVNIVDGKDVETGLIADEHYLLVKTNCTSCHSAQLITQNRATREGWESMIRWMQANQKLWDLGENESLILDYLSKNYAPEASGRRKNLENIDWYEYQPN